MYEVLIALGFEVALQRTSISWPRRWMIGSSSPGKAPVGCSTEPWLPWLVPALVVGLWLCGGEKMQKVDSMSHIC